MLRIEDLGTDMGTFVNGVRISTSNVVAGDLIAVGHRRLRVSEDNKLVTQEEERETAIEVQDLLVEERSARPAGGRTWTRSCRAG